MTDIIFFSPHTRFFKSLTPPDRADYREQISSPTMKHAIEGCVAQMAMEGYSREELDGALAFAHLIQNFSEPELSPRQKPLPTKTLQSS